MPVQVMSAAKLANRSPSCSPRRPPPRFCLLALWRLLLATALGTAAVTSATLQAGEWAVGQHPAEVTALIRSLTHQNHAPALGLRLGKQVRVVQAVLVDLTRRGQICTPCLARVARVSFSLVTSRCKAPQLGARASDQAFLTFGRSAPQAMLRPRRCSAVEPLRLLARRCNAVALLQLPLPRSQTRHRLRRRCCGRLRALALH